MIMVWAFVSVKMAITSQAEYAQLEPHVVPTQSAILLEFASAHLDLPTTVETVLGVPRMQFGAQMLINAFMYVASIHYTLRQPKLVSAIPAMESMEAHVKLVLTTTSFLMVTV
jgi:hypothetical protein